MTIVEDVEKNKLEETARNIIAKANTVKAEIGGETLMGAIFGGAYSQEEYEKKCEIAGERGYNILDGNILALFDIKACKLASEKAESKEAMELTQKMEESYDQICVDAVVSGIKSGTIPKDAANLSTEEFFEMWKSSDGETEKAIVQAFEPIKGETMTAVSNLINPQTQEN